MSHGKPSPHQDYSLIHEKDPKHALPPRKNKFLSKLQVSFKDHIKISVTTATIITVLVIVGVCVVLKYRRKAMLLSYCPGPLFAVKRDFLEASEVANMANLTNPSDLLDPIKPSHVIVKFSARSFNNVPSLLQAPSDHEHVVHLSLRSPVTQNTLHHILQRFRHIETLEVIVDAVCSGFRDSQEEIIATPIELPKLKRLVLTDGIHCPVFEWGFLLSTPNVVDVEVWRFQLNPKNFHAIYSTLSSFGQSISKIAITRSFICIDKADDGECDINKLKFPNLRQLSVTKRIEDEAFLLHDA